MTEAVNEQQARLLQGLEGCPSQTAQAGAGSCCPAGSSWHGGRVTAARSLWQGGTGSIGYPEEHETKAVFARAGSTIPAALTETSPLVV